MSQQAYDNFQKVDQQLNEVYQQITNLYASDTVFVERLRASQRIWVQFRDAELAMKYPPRGADHYGSIHPVCRAYYLRDLTEERIETLNHWLDSSEESEACTGSVMVK